MRHSSRVWSAGKIVLLLAALGATFLVSAFVAVRLAVRAREVEVPALSGRTVNDASARLEALGLTLRVDETPRVDATVPAGHILHQDPAPGVRVRRARSVRVRVSAGEATTTVQGSGWGALAWEPVAGRLIVEQVYDHQSNIGQGSDPILVIDAWEHAFYLQYLNDKASWVDAFWEVADWQAAATRFDTARAK